MATRSQSNVARVVMGHCWDDGADLDELDGGGRVCGECGRTWRVSVVETVPVMAELAGKAAYWGGEFVDDAGHAIPADHDEPRVAPPAAVAVRFRFDA